MNDLDLLERENYGLCLKCESKPTSHKSGVCQPCRAYKCKHCKKVIQNPLGGFRTYCSVCRTLAKNKQMQGVEGVR